MTLIVHLTPTEAQDRIIIPTKATSDRYLELMNRKHAVIREGGKVLVVEFVGDHRIEYSTPRETEQYYRNIMVELGEGQKSLGRWWLDHERRRQYEALIFDPGQPISPREHEGWGGHVYNRWLGLAVKPRPGNWSMYRDNLLNNMCGGNETYFNYVLDWMAHGVQKPEEKPGVAIVLRSDERGTGKSTTCRYYAELFGSHALETASAAHLTGRFNGHLETIVLLVLSEAVWAGDHSAEAILKALITDSAITVENKHRAVQQRPSYLRVMMTANSSWVVPAGWSERRFFVLEAGDRGVGNPMYWLLLAKQMKEGGLAGFLHDLLARDISEFNPRNVPVTEALLAQKIQSMDENIRWLFSCLERGKWSPEHARWETQIGRNELYDLYLTALSKSASRKPRAMQTELGRLLEQVFPGANKGPYLRLAESRVRHYLFPPLEEARGLFAAFMQAPDSLDLFAGAEPDNQVHMLPTSTDSTNLTNLIPVDFTAGRKVPDDE